jgi:hypothetical protein
LIYFRKAVGTATVLGLYAPVHSVTRVGKGSYDAIPKAVRESDELR